MHTARKVCRYMVSETKVAMGFYYLFLFGVVALFSILHYTKIATLDNVGGFGISSAIFLFVTGLTSFRSPFFFLQANGISRFMQFKGTLLAFGGLALFVAIVDLGSKYLLRLFLPYQTVYMLIYQSDSFLGELAWKVGWFFLTIVLGWFLSLLIYRCNKTTRILLGLSPVFLLTLMLVVHNATGGKATAAFVDFFLWSMGVPTQNGFLGLASFAVLSGLGIGGSFLLLRKAPIKS